MKRLYIIKCNNSKEELDLLETKKETSETYPLSFIYEDLESDNGLDRFRGFDINDIYSVIVIDDLLINQFIQEMSDFGYKFDLYDGNNDLLNDKLNLNNTPDYFKEEIKEYYFKMFDCDDILDKINNKIELNDIDKLILKNP